MGEALAAAAVERNWVTLGLGAACWMSRPSEARRSRCECEALCAAGGVGAVARLAENVTSLRVSTAGVSSAGLERLVAKAKHTSLATINGLDVARFRAEGPDTLNAGLLRRFLGSSHGEDGP